MAKAASSTAFTFLTVSPSARGAALGEAMTALGGDVTSAFWNPALLLDAKGSSFSAQENFFIQGSDHTFLSLGIKQQKWGGGVSLNFRHIGDLELRQTPSSQPLGTFSEDEAAISVGFAYAATPSLSVGVSGKLLYQKLEAYDNFGTGADFGLLYRMNQRLAFGASVLNAGPDFKLVSEPSPLPLSFRTGASFLWRDFLFASEILFPRGTNAKTGWGVERAVRNLTLRAGYQTGYDEKNFSFGLGVGYRNFRLDYAFVPYQSDLGSAHRFGIVGEL
ncbi:MAG: PorV/PorQ family protein [Limisphaerales bacterium]